MKKLLILLILLVTTSVSAQKLRDNLKVNNEYFNIVYSEVLQQPKSVNYVVRCPDGTASRSGMEFYTIDGIRTSDSYDYVDNQWDKGHMAPAASFNCNTFMLRTTFTYVNCALQQQALNRGVWKALEIRERALAMNKTVSVTIFIDFNKPIRRVSGGAAIPSGFYKELRYGNIKECYYFLNVTPATRDINSYKCNCR
jgi:DNA/RNA endonuclease G (NUC1)